MTTELTSLSDIQTKIREKVQDALLEFIPETHWNALIKRCWEDLTQPKPGKGYGQGPSPSELENLIRVEMKRLLVDTIQQWASAWRLSPEVQGEAQTILQMVVKEAANAFLLQVGSEIVGRAVSSIHSEAVCPSCHRPAVQGQSCSCGTWVPSR
jgi:hypothetical protein